MKKKCRTALTILLLLCLGAIGWVYVDNQRLALAVYRVEADVHESIRIVQLSDLHSARFGEDNCELVEMVAAQQPDIIVTTGDLMNQDDEGPTVVCSLISELSQIAPVYFGYGNHESTWAKTHPDDLTGRLTAAGAIVLDNDFLDVEINGTPIRIGGYMGYYRQPGMLTEDEEQKELELAFADSFEATERLKLLLNHIPTQWVDWNYIDKFPVDLVFSGHYHGGMIRIPLFNRGLYAPYVGWFPPYTKGVYSGEKATCVLSAGLGSEHSVPRIYNPPEIVTVDLVPTLASE